MVHLRKKAVAFETSCVYSVVYGSPKEESSKFRNFVIYTVAYGSPKEERGSFRNVMYI